jgi:HSP20 family protein
LRLPGAERQLKLDSRVRRKELRMAIVRWAPFTAFTSLEREMQDMLDRFGTESKEFPWKPSMDVYRENGTLVLRAELPGIDPETDLTIDVEDNVLHIRGEKTFERELDETTRFIKERRFGSFRRDLMLPEGVDPGAVTASYEKGILTVEVPLPAEVTAGGEKVAIDVIEK